MTTQSSGVSICIPTYNRGDLLGETLASIRAQTVPPEKILVQDNASDDDTEQVLGELAATLPQLEVLRNPEKVTLWRNFNLALDRGDTEFLMVLSSDDQLEPKFIESCLQVLADPSIDAVVTNYFWLTGGVITERDPKVPGGVYENFLKVELMENPFQINFALFRRSLLDRLRSNGSIFRNALYTCDYDLWFRIAASGARIYYLADFAGGRYRTHAGNVSNNNILMTRSTYRTILYNRKALRRACPWSYRYKMMRLATHALRDWSRGRPVDKRVTRLLTREAFGWWK